MATKRLTILFIEVTDGFDDDGHEHELMARLEHRFRDRLSEYDGVFRKAMEEGFIVTFEDANEGLEYAIEMQKMVQSHEEHVAIRIGINSGRVTLDDEGDLYGKSVNIAARVQGRSRPDEIYFTQYTYGVIDHSQFNFERMTKGRVKLKGVDEGVVLSRVLYDQPRKRGSLTSWLNSPYQNLKKHPHVRLISGGLAIFVIFLAVTVILVSEDSNQSMDKQPLSNEFSNNGAQVAERNQVRPRSKNTESSVRSIYRQGESNQYNRLIITRLFNKGQNELFEVFNPSSDTQQLLGVFESSPGIDLTLNNGVSVPPCGFVVGYSDLSEKQQAGLSTGRTINEDSSFGAEEGFRIVSTVSGDTLMSDAVGWSETPESRNMWIEIGRDFYENTPAKIEDGSMYYLRRKRDGDSQPLDTNNNHRDFELVTGFPDINTGFTSSECKDKL